MQKQGKSLIEVIPSELMEAWEGKKSFTRVLGIKVATKEDNIFVNGYTLERERKKEHGAVRWRVIKFPDEKTMKEYMSKKMHMQKVAKKGSL
jgi:hypothetical protein